MTTHEVDGDDRTGSAAASGAADAGPGDPAGQAASLLDRWQAHHTGSTPGTTADAALPKHAAPRRMPTPSERGTDSVAASRAVLGALGRDTGEAREASETSGPGDPSGAGDPSDPGDPGAAPPPAVRTPAAAPEVGPSLNRDFAPKLGARRVVGLLLLVSLAATAGAAYLAYDDPRPLTLGGAGTLLALTLMVYAARAGSAPMYLAIRSGQLEVRRGKTLEKFDLTSRFTRIEVVGRPGRPGWKVLLGRFGRDPLVISAWVVDPTQFTSELERYRPRP